MNEGKFVFSLAAYTVTINKTGSKKSLPLDAFDGSTSFLEMLHDFIKSRRGSDVTYAHKKRILRFAAVDKIQSDAFTAKLQTGEYGFTSDLYDTNLKANAYNRKMSEAEMLPCGGQVNSDTTIGFFAAMFRS
ncbi:hypothetical protein [Massilia cavernae]|uniref:hypothetical protein n=1 Tax=Massilia cavernae TaxID=2320864 RepID=UPI0011C40735|nr:hypothetical protein [Massilia cavernae]